MNIQEKTGKNDKEKQIIYLIKYILGDNFKKTYIHQFLQIIII